MIKYLNESELNEAYLSVISYGSAVLKHYENWQVEQIRNHAEIELIKLKGTKSENQKHLINESQHVIETIDSFKRSNLFEAEQLLIEAEQLLINDRIEKIKVNKLKHDKMYKQPTSPTIRAFCFLVIISNHYKLLPISNFVDENGVFIHAEKSFKTFCEFYHLKYTVRGSKNHVTEKDVPKYYDKIRELIFPKIDQMTIDAIEAYINSKKLHQ